MPARSKSQQRLFGMVHAYNKGELHGSRALLRRISAISKNISEEDAEHFARTKHKDLPEKKAQVMLRPEDVKALYSQIPPGAYESMLPDRSTQRRSFLSSVFRGAGIGATVGGLTLGTLGAFLAHRASKDNPSLSTASVLANIGKAGLRCGFYGATRGGAIGSVAGAGLNIIDRIRS